MSLLPWANAKVCELSMTTGARLLLNVIYLMNTAHNKLCSEVRGYGRRAEIWVNLSTSSFHKYPYRDSNFHPEVVTPNTYVCYAVWIMAVTEGACRRRIHSATRRCKEERWMRTGLMLSSLCSGDTTALKWATNHLMNHSCSQTNAFSGGALCPLRPPWGGLHLFSWLLLKSYDILQ